MRTTAVLGAALIVVGLLMAPLQTALSQADPKASAQAIDAIIYSIPT
jgi:hypothetical protein